MKEPKKVLIGFSDKELERIDKYCEKMGINARAIVIRHIIKVFLDEKTDI